jgi:hypothetical protein
VKGDITRETFRSDRHYWGVLRQQGRVDLDADWNEQVRIVHHHDVVRTNDLVGPSGGPLNRAGFLLTVDDDGVVTIGRGRYYVAGILAENDGPVGLASQPDPPVDPLPDDAGLHLAYLDVWDRHVTALDEPTIREVALGGPDTATRARTVWQVCNEALVAPAAELTAVVAALAAARTSGDTAAETAALQDLRNLARAAAHASPLEPAGGSLEAGTGTMAARSEPSHESDELCRFGRGGGYRRLQNHLYRVEIHTPAVDATRATFKWSRDNGSVVFSVIDFATADSDGTTSQIIVRGVGLDGSLSLHKDDWVELVSDDLISRGEPGQLVRIDATGADAAGQILYVTPPVHPKAAALHPQVRRWDLPVGGLMEVTPEWQELEDGVKVSFGAGTFHAGDYWVVPARANTGDVEWPPFPEYPGHRPEGAPEQLPPLGVAHRRAPVAVLVHDGRKVVASIDLRALFPPVTDLVAFAYVGGDGQQPGLPSGQVPQPLQVSVGNGSRPVAGALVEFRSHVASDMLDAGGAAAATVVAVTGAGGVASATWTVDPAVVDHRVTARLLEDDGVTPTRGPVVFSCQVNHQLQYLGGDGQQGLPGEAVEPLRAWVSAGRWPVAGARVEFTVSKGHGILTPPPGPTESQGIVECGWRLDPDTARQQVTAQLLDAAGAPVHEAKLVFTANLSTAGRVAFTAEPACFDLASAATVEEALNALCRRDQGGCCTYTIDADDDLAARWEAIMESGFEHGAICFREGAWVLDEPLRVHGKGDITVRGLGRASRIIARKGEKAFHFEDCTSVTFCDLALETREATTHDGLGGAVTVVDCGPVTIERVVVAGPAGPEPLTAGIAVSRRPDSGAAGPLRIRDCDLTIGEQQSGILVVNGDVVHIEGNTLGATVHDGSERLGEYLQNARYRAAARRQLVDASAEATALPEGAEPAGTAVISVSAGDGEEVAFRSSLTHLEFWKSVLEGAGETRQEVIAAANRIVDAMLRDEGTYERRRVFRSWYEETEKRWSPAGARGVVVAGVRAQEVRIVGNVVTGHLQGVSVAVSGKDLAPVLVGRVSIRENVVRLPSWSLVAQRTEGIYLGNCHSAVIADNVVIVGEGSGSDPEIRADGVRAGGVFGPRLLVRSNHVEAAVAGVRVEPVGTQDEQPRRWVASDNINLDGPCLEAPCEVTEDGNVPARIDACAGDRPV